MKLAVFDFDGTLFTKDTLPFMLSQYKYLNRPRLSYYTMFLSLIPLFIQYKMEFVTKLSREQMKVLAVRKFNTIFAGMSEQELSEFFCLCAQKMIPFLNPDVVEEMNKAKKDGYHTVLLSGTYDYLLDYIGRHLGFHTVIGSPMAFDNGRYDPHQETEIVIGDAKLKKLRARFAAESVDWEKSIAYADGYSDLELLEAVGVPIVVRPDKELRPIAERRNWKVIW